MALLYLKNSPPDVVGTPDFIAPEVIATQHLDKKDPKRKLRFDPNG